MTQPMATICKRSLLFPVQFGFTCTFPMSKYNAAPTIRNGVTRNHNDGNQVENRRIGIGLAPICLSSTYNALKEALAAMGSR